MFSRNNIIAMSNTSAYQTERNQQKKLDKIIKWLFFNHRARNLLEWKNAHDSGDYFLNYEMNLMNSKTEGPYESYSYNTITAILLALLLDTYDHPFFQALIKDNYSSNSSGEKWMEEIKDRIGGFKGIWQDKGDGRDWEVIAINICSQLYRLTLPPKNTDILGKINQDVRQVYITFLALPDDQKIDAYKKIEQRMNWITKELESIVENLDPVEQLEYRWNRDEIDI